MPTPEFIRHLVERYKNNQASDEELEVFFHLLEQGELDSEIISQINWSHEVADTEPVKAIKRIHPFRKWRVAAAILLLLSVSSYFFFFHSKTQVMDIARQTQEQRFKDDVQPGGNRATLTLANGSVIVLDTSKNGRLADQGTTTVLKVRDGQLAYDAVEQQTEKPVYNIVATPKGGQYAIVLPDGSKVWLNAVSSLRFPTAFTGMERIVELTGEAYFEVAKNTEKPFIVLIAGETKVEVTGTQFNVNAYTNETAIKTTLLEGAVKVKHASNEKDIIPGEQAIIGSNGEVSIAKNADTEDATAWKNGKFYFDNAPIETIMRQVERWYDVTIQYEGKITTGFTGTIGRDVPVSRLLKILEMTGDVHFIIQDRTITVTP